MKRAGREARTEPAAVLWQCLDEGAAHSKPLVEVDPLHSWVVGPDFLLQLRLQAAD